MGGEFAHKAIILFKGAIHKIHHPNNVQVDLVGNIPTHPLALLSGREDLGAILTFL
jgi:hypothetical protein